MFRHKNKDENKNKKEEQKNLNEQQIAQPVVEKKELPKDTSPVALRELLEKNLKWSQIIYEQNRKINRKLFWYDFIGWIKLTIIIVPIILAFIFLPPLVQDFWQKYSKILQTISGSSKEDKANLEQVIQLLPVNPVRQEQLKQILK